jgi:hypothetical protein
MQNNTVRKNKQVCYGSWLDDMDNDGFAKIMQ